MYITALSSWTTALLTFPCQTFATAFHNAAPLADATPLTTAKYSVQLTRRLGHREDEGVSRRGVYTSPTVKRLRSSYYSVDILWGDRNLSMILDTGALNPRDRLAFVANLATLEVKSHFQPRSSDTWAAASNFTCLDNEGNVTYQGYCGFGQYLSKGFGNRQITNETFEASYGVGLLKGALGYEDITIGGLTVEHQEVAIAYRGTWYSDNVTAGVFGLSYPDSTSAWVGIPFRNDDSGLRPYNPWFWTAFKRGLIPPVFSMALQRGEFNEGAGEVAFGGLPDVKFSHEFVSRPLRLFNEHILNNSRYGSEYLFDINGWVLDGEFLPERGRKVTYGIDSGNPGLDVTDEIAVKINSRFSPPGVPFADEYKIPCNATPPQLAVRINGTDFPLDGRDLITSALGGFHPRERGYCLTAIRSSGRAFGLNVVGDPFLKNVIAVFDVGASQIRFAPHVY